MSTVLVEVDVDSSDEALIERLLQATNELSEREAAEAVGLSHTQITRYRGPREQWPKPTAKTRRKIGDYLARDAVGREGADSALHVLDEIEKLLRKVRDDLAS